MIERSQRAVFCGKTQGRRRFDQPGEF